ncbi:hypothetical protein [Actinomadura parmotrematis]|uniref:Uncharacterized protein n=1 Tax=Actinomadura parmotrematis TaxID=2864039 RepID=A0ABS7G3E7_9ACTN|nr:hypothetical protein [Actinomadura parmotrematis]MBW8487237.1 hypothetical protein [Actinomadura parmotrematis]
MNDVQNSAEDEVLARLRADFPGHKIWRSKRWDGRPGDWAATLLDPAAGVDPTVIRNSPSELRGALIDQRERALAERRAAGGRGERR